MQDMLSRFNILLLVEMDIPTLDVAQTQTAGTNTEPSGSQALVQREAVEPSKSAITDPVVLFDKGTNRWKIETEGQNM